MGYWWLTLWEWMSPLGKGMFYVCSAYNGNERKIKSNVIHSWNYSQNWPCLPTSTWFPWTISASWCLLLTQDSWCYLRVWKESRRPSFWKLNLSSWKPRWLGQWLPELKCFRTPSYAVFNMIHVMTFFQGGKNKFEWLPKSSQYRGGKVTQTWNCSLAITIGM